MGAEFIYLKYQSNLGWKAKYLREVNDKGKAATIVCIIRDNKR